MSGDDDPTIVNPEKLSHEKSAEICGQCHGIQQFRNDKAWRHGDGIRYRAGGDLDALRVVIRHPENVTEPAMTTYMTDYQKHYPTALDGQFWRDGMVRVSGREYNGLIGRIPTDLARRTLPRGCGFRQSGGGFVLRP